ncbi:MAG: glycoside hydrolase family 127 protein [Prevotellaceae bacterium]|nr:glycoside hydrolase family 127 protein [Prevotellaceae bacterium]
MMKRQRYGAHITRLLTAMAAIVAWIGTTAQAQVVQPLRAVECDSLLLCDFFWNGVQREIDEAIGDSVRAWPWQIGSETTDGLAQRVAAWEQGLQGLNLWGLGAEASWRADDFKHLLRESVELGMLTRQARFFDLAERLLANPAIRHWRDSGKDNVDREVADALRAVSSVAYATSGHDVFVNMLVRCNVHLQSDSVDFFAQIVNSAPWYNDTSLRIVRDMSLIDVTVDSVLSEYERVIIHEEYGGDSVDVAFHIRIPSWVGSGDMLPRYTAKARRQQVLFFVNGSPVKAEMKDGYAVIKRRWTVGDLLVVKMPTPILRVYDKQDDSRVALQRGPLLYVSGNKASGWNFDPESAINHDFSQQLKAIALKGELYNASGKKPFDAVPAYLSDERDKIFMPVR